MTDVTAQAFREAARLAFGSNLHALFIAAAEQREALDAINAQLDTYMAENETLTAERDMLRQAYETVQDNEFAALSPSTHAQNLAQQVRTLTAELDDARHERELMRVKLARATYHADTK